MGQLDEHGLRHKQTPDQLSRKGLRTIYEAHSSRPERRVALISTFAPRKCGIATFATDIVEQLGLHAADVSIDVYALDGPESAVTYENVAGTIDPDDPSSIARVAKAINESGADAVWLQHEYGIFGKLDGLAVSDLVDRLAAPLILTAHTVLGKPNERQHAILTHLVTRASKVMVMSRHARDLLAERYGAPHEILRIIEHGAPDRPFGRQAQFKGQLGLTGRNVLTTFGLLGPGKGIEQAIRALPAIIADHPHTIYRIIGATHPKLVALHGEAYRDGLKTLAAKLGVADHIQWDNRFLDTDELLDQLEACDIYLTPYPGLQQSTSGTLSYAVALGKAVVSTPYQHARELLEGGIGQLIEPNCSEAIAAAVNALLADRQALEALQRRAYAKGRQTIWPRFAQASALLVEEAVAPKAISVPISATPSLAAVFALSDATGILQHAIGIIPDRRHGYCLDDNARALMVMNVAAGIEDDERAHRSAIYASFVQHAWNEDAGVFRNFMRFERTWCEDAGSEDSNGRALWALGHTMRHAPDAALVDWAARLFDQAAPRLSEIGSPRAIAFAMLGATGSLHARPDHVASRTMLAKGADFLERLLGGARRPDWAWFEAVLGYDNPRLSQALIEAGEVLGEQRFITAGLETLDWIARQQISATGRFRPIGCESFGHDHAHLPFDQQPLEAQAAIEACACAFRISGNERWRRHALAAWNWFFGANDRGAVLAEIATGRCRDGINPRGANANCGAESILAFQLGHISMIGLTQAVHGDSGGMRVGQPEVRTTKFAAYP